MVIPEINGEGRVTEPLIANPNCTTAVGAMALWPIHQKYKLKKAREGQWGVLLPRSVGAHFGSVFRPAQVLMATYQAASGAGAPGMAELEDGRAPKNIQS